jgi:hypothetical protein
MTTGWIGFETPEEGEEGEAVDTSLDGLDEHGEEHEVGEDGLRIQSNIDIMADPMVVTAMSKLNNLAAKMSKTRLAELRRINLLPIETMRKKKAAKKLATVRYNPHFSLSPALRTSSRQSLSRSSSNGGGGGGLDAMKMSRGGSRGGGGGNKLLFEPNIDVDFYSLEANDEDSLFEQEFRDPMYAPPNPKTPLLDVLIPKDTRLDENADLLAAQEELKGLLVEAAASKKTGGCKLKIDISTIFSYDIIHSYIYALTIVNSTILFIASFLMDF